MVVGARRSAELAATLIERVGAAATGTTVLVPVSSGEEADLVHRWCTGTGNSVYAVHEAAVEVYRGSFPDTIAGMAPDRRPGYRLWIYTNFHCNLACDYCCVESSPKADPRILDADTVSRLVTEGLEAGVREFYLTGGEPFLNPDIAKVVSACATAAPTTLLTNGMLFRGTRRDWLEAMPRDGLTLQISVDSATPDLHDAHRGAGSWARAIDGVRTAKELGFTVRLATTLSADSAQDAVALAALCCELGLAADETIVRTVARQGNATAGIMITRATVVPEVCVTAEGIYWHPVAALDESMRVSTEMFPLERTIHAVTREFLDYRRAGDVLAASFPCA